MPTSTLTFPTPKKDEPPFVDFTYEIDGIRYQIPKFTEAIQAGGVDRRLLEQNLTNEFGARMIVAFQVAHKDSVNALRAFDYLDAKQQVELFDKWASFTGAPLGESSGPTSA